MNSIRIIEYKSILIINIHLHTLNLLTNSHNILLATISNLMSTIQQIIANVLLLLNNLIPIIEITLFILHIILINLLNKNWQSLFTIKFECFLHEIVVKLLAGLEIVVFLQEILIFLAVAKAWALDLARLWFLVLLLFFDFNMDILFTCVAFGAILAAVYK